MKKTVLAGIAGVAMAFSATSAQAQSCTGTCGDLGPDGVVTAPPQYGPNYQYVTTNNGVGGAGQIEGVGGTNGSEYVTAAFSGAAGDELNLYFNYVTSDGSSFSDYAFAQLLRNGSSVGYLFTARTTPSGDTSPGFGLPANISTLTPATSPINPGATTWSPLGGSSGDCFNAGCGSTGWIGSSYTLADAGLYTIRFGVTNTGDTSFQSGLAFAGVTINDTPIGVVPEPSTWALMILGFGAIGGAMRRRKASTAVRFA